MVDLRFTVATILPALLAVPGTVRSATVQRPRVVKVEAPRDELLGGYLQWMRQHPEARPHAAPSRLSPAGPITYNSAASQGTEPLLIRMPSIELYSPSGKSLYRGTESEKNAEFIRGLPYNIAARKTSATGEVRPTLQEAAQMLAELHSYEAVPSAANEYTVMAITYRDEEFCRAQNEALEELKGRARGLGINVLEVRLHK